MPWGTPFAFRYLPGIGTVVTYDNRYFKLANGPIDDIQEDGGYFYTSGVFTSAYPNVTGNLIRLTTSGTYDPLPGYQVGFNAGTNPQFVIDNDSIYLGGGFTRLDGSAIERVAKINLTSGGLDPTFHSTSSGYSSPASPRCLAVVSGLLYMTPGTATAVTYRGTTVTGYLHRINATTGNLDTSVSLGNFNGDITSIIVQSGYLTAVGAFSQYNGVTVGQICRINLTTGALDTSFNTGGAGFTGSCQTLVQDDGFLYVGGDMTAYNGTAINRIVKLNATTGARDTSFVTTSTSGANNTVYSILPSVDGTSLYIGGAFPTYNGLGYRELVKVNKNTNVIDTSFSTVGKFISGDVRTIIEEDVNTIALFGNFLIYNNVRSCGFLKVNTSGNVILSSYPGASPSANSGVRTAKLYNGRYYWTGSLACFGGTLREGLAKFDKNTLELDPTFSPALVSGTATAARQTMRIGPSSIYVGGSMTTSGSIVVRGLAKIDKTTGANQTFPTPSNTGATITEQYLTNNSLWVLQGSANTFSGASAAFGFARIDLISGTVDPTVTSGFAFGAADLKSVIVDSGYVYLAGSMTTYRGTTISGKLMRVSETTGALDTAFNTLIGTGFNSQNIYHMAIESGTLYACGDFTTYKGSGTNATRIIKLNLASGTVDPTFITGSGFDGTVYNFEMDDQHMYLYGSFSNYNGSSLQKGVAKIDKVTGAIVSSFVTSGTYIGGTMRDGVVTPSGHLLTVGNHTTVLVSGASYPISRSILIDKNTGSILF